MDLSNPKTVVEFNSCVIATIIFLLLVLSFVVIMRILSKKHPKNVDISSSRALLTRPGWDASVSTDRWRCVNGTGDDVASLDHPAWFSLKEMEEATDGFACPNVIGRGQYGVVFHGLLMDDTQVAIKNLYSNRREKKEFYRKAEAMMLIRHNNLVKLVGYCAEGDERMVVHEYVDNGSLHHWLHSSKSNVSPLTWNIRMQIIIGIAKGLAHLHEATKTPVIHFNLKPSNVLVDRNWNPKLCDFGINRLLGPEWSNTRAPPEGMSGYIGPEYDRNHALGEKSDVYSFGILIMEIVSGKPAIETTVNEIEEYLVDWIKFMVAKNKYDLIIDPNLRALPTVVELERILLIALRCVDFEAQNRPTMREIIHMLETRDLLLTIVT